MIVIAHRGANKEALENSRQAMSLAIEAGATRIETDLQLTKDGKIVIMHDSKLGHTTSEKGSLLRLNSDDLKAMRLVNGEPLLFLDECLDLFYPKVEFNLELKGKNKDIIPALLSYLRPLKDTHGLIVSAFHTQLLIELGKAAPHIERACLWGIHTLQQFDLNYFMPDAMMHKAKATIFHPEAALVDEGMMGLCRQNGWRVYPWVPMKGEEQDKENLWQKLYSLGVDGLCTNYPREFKKWISHFIAKT